MSTKLVGCMRITAFNRPKRISSYVTKKHGRFVSTPMFGKSTKLVPGIGDAYCQKLKEYDITKASQLLEVYIGCDGDRLKFTNIIQQLTGGNPCHMNQAYDGIDQFYQLNYGP